MGKAETKVYICEKCEKPFTVAYRTTVRLRFCSRYCRYGIRNRDTIYKCASCGNEFSPNYNISKAQRSGMRFCSKKCKAVYQRNNGPAKRYPTRQDLVDAVTAAIAEEGKHMTAKCVCQKLGISSRRIAAYHISVAEINSYLGFTRPASSYEVVVGEYLTKLKIQHATQVTFPDLRSSKGFPLRYDFSVNIAGKCGLIEIDGPSHWDVNYQHYSTDVVSRDRKKNRYALVTQVPLLRVRAESKNVSTKRYHVYYCFL